MILAETSAFLFDDIKIFLTSFIGAMTFEFKKKIFANKNNPTSPNKAKITKNIITSPFSSENKVLLTRTKF